MYCIDIDSPDSKAHGVNMGPIWGRDPGGPHVGPMNFAIWVTITEYVGRIGINVHPNMKSKLMLP